MIDMQMRAQDHVDVFWRHPRRSQLFKVRPATAVKVRALALFAVLPLYGQDWPTFNGDYSGRRYSALTQVNAGTLLLDNPSGYGGESAGACALCRCRRRRRPEPSIRSA